MNAPTLTYEIVENSSLDCAEFSLCPNCSSKIIRLADGCSICPKGYRSAYGWSDRDKLQGGSKNCSSKPSSILENKLAIPCLIKQPKQSEVRGIIQRDLGNLFTVYIPSNGSTVKVSKLLVYPDFSGIGDKKLQGGKAKCSSKKSEIADPDVNTKILELLQGGKTKCSSKKSITSKNVLAKSKSDELISKCSSKISSPPCTDKKKETTSSDRSITKSNEEDRLDKGCSTPKNVLAILSIPPAKDEDVHRAMVVAT